MSVHARARAAHGRRLRYAAVITTNPSTRDQGIDVLRKRFEKVNLKADIIFMRVSYDELDYSDYSVYTYEEQPFTGIAFECHSSGQLVAEDSYIDGVREGISREWYLTGKLHYEVYYKSGALHGIAKEWHENGLLKSDFLYEYGALVEGKSFSEEGNLNER